MACSLALAPARSHKDQPRSKSVGVIVVIDRLEAPAYNQTQTGVLREGFYALLRSHFFTVFHFAPFKLKLKNAKRQPAAPRNNSKDSAGGFTCRFF